MQCELALTLEIIIHMVHSLPAFTLVHVHWDKKYYLSCVRVAQTANYLRSKSDLKARQDRTGLRIGRLVGRRVLLLSRLSNFCCFLTKVGCVGLQLTFSLQVARKVPVYVYVCLLWCCLFCSLSRNGRQERNICERIEELVAALWSRCHDHCALYRLALFWS